MGIQQVALTVQNDGNVSQSDCADTAPGGVYYRIEVYRCSHPAGRFGVTYSGSRAEDICGEDHLASRSNQVFRYIFGVGSNTMHTGEIPIVLEGREEFNPFGMPDGSWAVRLRDLDPQSITYGGIIAATAEPSGTQGAYRLHYELRLAKDTKPVPSFSPLRRRVTELNATLPDLGTKLTSLPDPVGIKGERLHAMVNVPGPLSIDMSLSTSEVTGRIESVLQLISHPDFSRFRKNLDSYEDFGDFGPRAVHPGTNLKGNSGLLPIRFLHASTGPHCVC